MNRLSSAPLRYTFTNGLRMSCSAARLALLIILCAVAVTAQDEDEIVNIESNLVVLNVTITDARDAYVHGLTRNDFKVFEDGKPQKITTFGVEDTPFAAAILIDTSGSMEGRVTLARAAAIRFLDGLRPEDVAAVYRFDSKVEMVQDFSPSRDLSPVAYTARARGMTVLYDAVARAAQDLAKRPEKRKAILILSDGADTQSRMSLKSSLDMALAANATVYAVDMSGGGDGKRALPVPALRELATKSGGRYVATPGGQELREAFINIGDELTNQYTIGYQMEPGMHDGKWRSITVDISRPAVKLRTRSGYRAPKR